MMVTWGELMVIMSETVGLRPRWDDFIRMLRDREIPFLEEDLGETLLVRLRDGIVRFKWDIERHQQHKVFADDPDVEIETKIATMAQWPSVESLRREVSYIRGRADRIATELTDFFSGGDQTDHGVVERVVPHECDGYIIIIRRSDGTTFEQIMTEKNSDRIVKKNGFANPFDLRRREIWVDRERGTISFSPMWKAP